MCRWFSSQQNVERQRGNTDDTLRTHARIRCAGGLQREQRVETNQRPPRVFEKSEQSTQEMIQSISSKAALSVDSTDPAVAGQDHDAEAEQLGHGEQLQEIKLFRGEQKEWDEFSTKFRSQVAAGDVGVAALMERVESVMLEEQAEAKDWAS